LSDPCGPWTIGDDAQSPLVAATESHVKRVFSFRGDGGDITRKHLGAAEFNARRSLMPHRCKRFVTPLVLLII
jgi:hypothetical protein